jgi:hypothetical protein
MLRRARWFVILATALLLFAFVMAAMYQLQYGIFWAVVSVFVLVADLVNRK